MKWLAVIILTSNTLTETSETTPEPSDTAISDDKLRLLFALLFSAPDLVSLDRIRQVLYPDGDDSQSPRQHLEALEEWLVVKELPLSLHQVGSGYRLLTSEDFAEVLVASRKSSDKQKLGPATLEVLSLVAYRQPVLKADIDSIRGVKSGSHLRQLLDLRLVRILGRAELPGRPFLYGTTREFLDKFGLRDLKELPESSRLAAPAESGVKIEAEVAETPPQD
ncbi:MAG TPA: SMC-Scp complex subunit ScpB [Planctomycetes bacterium]|jgi:segregation and condensation protein B|nr:SMC-Scp complex subunit ScpB [Planctomycetota bacterium]